VRIPRISPVWASGKCIFLRLEGDRCDRDLACSNGPGRPQASLNSWTWFRSEGDIKHDADLPASVDRHDAGELQLPPLRV